MTESFVAKIKRQSIFSEFARYLVVGGLSYILDSGVLFLFKEFVLPDWNGIGLLVATSIGFLAGLLLNYILSLIFVFNSARHENKGRSFRDFIVFAIIGLIGLLLTEAGMYFGAEILNFHYMIVKAFVTCIILMWNYAARKVLIFR